MFCGGATGKANFGFVSEYEKKASVPTGNTEFQINAGNLNFHSTGYDWLVIAGAKAMYKGDGRVNGVAYWAQQGFTSEELITLLQLDVRIANLVGSVLGSAVPTDATIWIDRDAAGFGWNVDTSNPLTVSRQSVDLLSALAHELGH